MILPLVQYALIRGRLRNQHRLVGYASLALAAVVAVSGVYVVWMMAFGNIAKFRLASVKFVFLDLTGIVLFCVYVWFSISAVRRRDIRLHVTALAASAYIPLDAALYGALIFLEVTCAAIVLLEWRSGRVRWPMPVLLGYYLLMHVVLTPIATSRGFQRFSDWFGMIGRTAS